MGEGSYKFGTVSGEQEEKVILLVTEMRLRFLAEEDADALGQEMMVRLDGIAEEPGFEEVADTDVREQAWVWIESGETW